MLSLTMKKVIVVLFVFGLFAQVAQAQDASIEKSIKGIQIGYPGVWAYVEPKLGGPVSLRMEAGLFIGYLSSSLYGKAGVISVPGLILEPRWYYDIKKRSLKSKKTAGNTGNFLALNLSYYPEWFVLSSLDGLPTISHFAAIPKWGIRRGIGQHFDFEAGIGLGVRRVFFEKADDGDDKTVAAGDLHLRFGYHF